MFSYFVTDFLRIYAAAAVFHPHTDGFVNPRSSIATILFDIVSKRVKNKCLKASKSIDYRSKDFIPR